MYYKMIEGKQKVYPSWFNDKQCEEFDAIRDVASKIPNVTGLVIFREGEYSVFIIFSTMSSLADGKKVPIMYSQRNEKHLQMDLINIMYYREE